MNHSDNVTVAPDKRTVSTWMPWCLLSPATVVDKEREEAEWSPSAQSAHGRSAASFRVRAKPQSCRDGRSGLEERVLSPHVTGYGDTLHVRGGTPRKRFVNASHHIFLASG